MAIPIALVPGAGLALARVGPQALYADTTSRHFSVVDYPPSYGMTRMHERYLMPGLVVGSIVACSRRRYFIAEAIFALTFTIDCAFILKGAFFGHALSALNLGAFVLAAATFFSTPAAHGAEGEPA